MLCLVSTWNFKNYNIKANAKFKYIEVYQETDLHGSLNKFDLWIREQIQPPCGKTYTVAAEANKETVFLLKFSYISIACLTKHWKNQKPTYFTFVLCEVHLKI